MSSWEAQNVPGEPARDSFQAELDELMPHEEEVGKGWSPAPLLDLTRVLNVSQNDYLII